MRKILQKTGVVIIAVDDLRMVALVVRILRSNRTRIAAGVDNQSCFFLALIADRDAR